MPDILAAAGSPIDLVWLFATVIIAGLVRGFAGFGSAMILMPVAASILSPVEAVIFLAASELLGPLPNIPGALRQGTRRDIVLLMLGVLVALPLGLYFLSHISPEPFGWVVSTVVLILVTLLLSGWRYHGRLSTSLMIGTGAFGGLHDRFRRDSGAAGHHALYGQQVADCCHQGKLYAVSHGHRHFAVRDALDQRHAGLASAGARIAYGHTQYRGKHHRCLAFRPER
tara:strand:- start:6421 stop:7101 length:681 start_codon:yes stop_codon:yes gene_type:complete